LAEHIKHDWRKANLSDEVQDEELAEHIKHDWRKANLSDENKALCGWAEKLTMTPGKMSENDVKGLGASGFSQRAISDDAAQVVGYFNYINRIAEGLGVDLEPDMKK